MRINSAQARDAASTWWRVHVQVRVLEIFYRALFEALFRVGRNFALRHYVNGKQRLFLTTADQ